jgi:hypothetical protein
MSLNLERLDRTVVGVTTFAEAKQEDRQFWHNRTPEERLVYVEWLRQRNWRYDPATTRFQRVLAVVERSKAE